MWIEKLSSGVLRVITPLGPRYVRPTVLQRFYLLWMFRHFSRLTQQVLSKREQQLVEELCTSQEFVSLLQSNGMEEVPIIGTVERLAPMLVDEPLRRPPVRVAESRTPVADQQSS